MFFPKLAQASRYSRNIQNTKYTWNIKINRHVFEQRKLATIYQLKQYTTLATAKAIFLTSIIIINSSSEKYCHFCIFFRFLFHWLILPLRHRYYISKKKLWKVSFLAGCKYYCFIFLALSPLTQVCQNWQHQSVC